MTLWNSTLAVVLLGGAGVWQAAAETQPGDCVGVEFDAKRPVVVAKVAGKSRTYYIKSAWEDPSCPSEAQSCRAKAYLVGDDLVLTGRTQGPFTCVSYQSPRDRKQVWTNGWILTASLSPVAPIASPKFSDWTGRWTHSGGEITISPGKRGTLAIEGEQTYRAAQNVHSGVIGAEANPAGAVLAFAEDGTVPFDNAEEGQCVVRMQRIGDFLAVEDNSSCGGSMVTFTGLYRRKR